MKGSMDPSQTPGTPSIPWYVQAFTEAYPTVYPHRNSEEADQQIGALLDLGVLSANDRALDVCCGQGRHVRAMRKKNIRCFGADLSSHLLDSQAGEDIPVCRADMRSLPFRSQSFDCAVQMFTSFGYFDSDTENRSVLAEVARVLKPEGKFVLDLMNRTPVIESPVPDSSSEKEGGIIVEESRRYDRANRRVEKTVRIRRGDRQVANYVESVRLFEPDEIRKWMDDSGFLTTTMMGDFDGSSFDSQSSPRMIVLASRRSL